MGGGLKKERSLFKILAQKGGVYYKGLNRGLNRDGKLSSAPG